MDRYRYLVCDVFADRPLEGNALAVFPDGPAIPDALLQPLARELSLSETVFAYPPRAGGHARIRIFTPYQELPFAGHPVLGSAIALAAPALRQEFVLETGRGLVPLRLCWNTDAVGSGFMSQPIPQVSRFERERELLAALGVRRAVLPIELYDLGARSVVVVLEDEAEVARLSPDLAALRSLVPGCAYCVAGSGTKWKARSFCPAVGIAEDPATGSAAGPLALHLVRHGLIAFGTEIEIVQGVEVARPSVLRARVEGTPSEVRALEVGGSAVVVAEGQFGF